MKTLIIGTTCIDLIMNIDSLPTNQHAVNTYNSSISIGGMAFNVYQVMKYCGSDAILASPIGNGRLASLMMSLLKEKGIEPFVVNEDGDNGICLCLVDNDGERTFISHHGAEYKFKKSWYKQVDFDEIDRIYVGGLEVEEDTGEQLIELLEEKKKEVFFAPGPRINSISMDKLNRIFALRPILHLNDVEAREFVIEEDLEKASHKLFDLTSNLVIITCVSEGAYYYDGTTFKLIPAYPNVVVDTIGAGDSHAGGLLACLQADKSVEEALDFANYVASLTIGCKGSALSEENIKDIKNRFDSLNK